MKKQYVGPYHDNIRLIIGDPDRVGSYVGVFQEDCDKDSIPRWYYTMTNGGDKDFDTKEEAKTDLDKTLLEEGYAILTQEQVDKFTILF